MPPSADGTASANTIAQLLMVTPARVRQLAKDGVIPKAGRDQYPLVGAVQGYIKSLKAGEATGKAEADAELTATKAALARLELARARGEVMAVEKIEVRWTRMITNARAKLLALAQRLPAIIRATDYSQRAVAAAVREQVHEVLSELAGYDGTRPAKSGAVGAAARNNGQRVGGRRAGAKPGGKRGAGAVAN